MMVFRASTTGGTLQTTRFGGVAGDDERGGKMRGREFKILGGCTRHYIQISARGFREKTSPGTSAGPTASFVRRETIVPTDGPPRCQPVTPVRLRAGRLPFFSRYNTTGPSSPPVPNSLKNVRVHRIEI